MTSPLKGHPPEGVGLKLVRAHEHLAALDNAVRVHLDSKPYRVSCNREANGTELVYRVHVVRPPPLAWSAIVGDCLQNMRTALEHLAWELVLKSGGSPDTGTSFPIFIDDPFVPGAKRLRERFNRNTKGMPPEAIALIKRLQPYMAADVARHPLYILNELARVDRHQVLHVVGATNDAIAMYSNREIESAGTHWIPVPGVDFRDEIYFGPFEDGAVIARFIFTPPNLAPPEMVMEHDFAFAISFSDSRESGPAARAPVVQTLADLFENIGGFVVPELTKFL